MKSKDIQNIVFLSKYRNCDGPTKMFHDLAGRLSLETIERWCKIINTTGSIDLAYSSSLSNVRSSSKNQSSGTVSVGKLATEQHISCTSIHRIFKKDPKYCVHKKRVQPFLTDAQKAEKKALANWIRNNFRKDQTMRILFSDEKIFVYNLQNYRMSAPSRSEASERR